MNDISDITAIEQLVDAFYTKVRNDALIGPVFISVIGNNWQPHLERMYSFWNAALFSVPGFKGNPFAKHAPLPIQPQHFNRWLELFNQTIDELFEGPVADDAKKRAELMARMFQAKMERMKDGFDKVII
jgi:hemoglobin